MALRHFVVFFTCCFFSLPAVNGIEWKDVNVIHVTDVHGWVSGHKHEPELDADYGDFVSLLEHMKEEAVRQKKDLYIIDSGDIAEGTGFTDSSDPRGLYLWPVIEKMPFSALTIGNHELYDWGTTNHMNTSGFLQFWNDTYVTGNVEYASNGQKLGSHYTILEGEFGTRIMVFGFLYDFLEAAPEVNVQSVKDVVKEDWFLNALKIDNIDAFVCPMHMGPTDEALFEVLSVMRDYHPTTPILFLCGHTHRREFKINDDRCASINSGRYFDTVTFVSFDLDDAYFVYEFATTSVENFVNISGVSEADFVTDLGKEVKGLILESRDAMDLDTVLGCAPLTYYRDSDVNEEDSLFGLLVYEIIPTVLFTNSNQWYAGSTGGLRYEVYEGDYTKDDAFTASPFRNNYNYVVDIQGSVLREFLDVVNGLAPVKVMKGRIDEWSTYKTALPNFAYTGTPDSDKYYDFIFDDYDLPLILETLESITGIAYQAQLYDIEYDTSTLWVAWGPYWADNC